MSDGEETLLTLMLWAKQMERSGRLTDKQKPIFKWFADGVHAYLSGDFDTIDEALGLEPRDE